MATLQGVDPYIATYQQLPELLRPQAGTTWPEWQWIVNVATGLVTPPLPVVVDFAVDRAANY